ncbi:MAG: fibrobacter succinogenes major paralogous domain-containing protein [Bacteroidales bacterium]|nr:fibrobacter succinogenes major paralogous domain-containing protein [Bacteroidales bacterium]
MKKMYLLIMAFVFVLGSTLKAQQISTFTDTRDGQVYNTIQIGTQTWMSENINHAVSGSWCYDDNDANCLKFGRLYTWESAKEACPQGWHIPTDSDWDVLVAAIGEKSVAGGTLKDNASGLWKAPNTGANNSTGYSALPAGIKLNNGSYTAQGETAAFWSIFDNGSGAWGRHLTFNSARFNSLNNPEHMAYSLRCLKN